MVDAVGLVDAGRPVPWDDLARRVGASRLDAYRAMFDRAQRFAE